MKETKKTKKTISPKYIVDMTTAETAADVADAFILGKVRAGIPISETELVCVKFNTVERVFEEIRNIANELDKNVKIIEDDKLASELSSIVEKYMNKKQPWYKRFWNWVKKPFTKKK